MDFENILDVVKKGLKDGAALSMEKIEELSRIGKLKIEEFSAKRKIERNQIDIGERVYDLVTDGKSKDIEKDILISNAVENINKLNLELEEISEKIDEEGLDNKNSNIEDDEITGI